MCSADGQDPRTAVFRRRRGSDCPIRSAGPIFISRAMRRKRIACAPREGRTTARVAFAFIGKHAIVFKSGSGRCGLARCNDRPRAHPRQLCIPRVTRSFGLHSREGLRRGSRVSPRRCNKQIHPPTAPACPRARLNAVYTWKRIHTESLSQIANGAPVPQNESLGGSRRSEDHERGSGSGTRGLDSASVP